MPPLLKLFQTSRLSREFSLLLANWRALFGQTDKLNLLFGKTDKHAFMFGHTDKLSVTDKDHPL